MPGECHWSRLPTEIRIQIYKYLIPEKHTFIIFHYYGLKVIPKGCHHNNNRVGECITTALFYVSKQIYRETRHLLFAANTFVFRVGVWNGYVLDDYTFRATSFRKSTALSNVLRLLTVETLQSIQHLEIEIYLTCDVAGWTFKRIYNWICKLTSALEQRHSLKTLKIHCIVGEYWRGNEGISWKTFLNEKKLMERPYILEAFVPLSGIENVTIEGVDRLFAAKLRNVMMDNKKKKLKELNYPVLQFKRRKVNTQRYVQDVKMTTRKYYDQQYDWDEVEA